MKILVTWVGPWLDKGEAAMMVSTAKSLRETIPSVNITCLTTFPPDKLDVSKYSNYDLKVLPGIISNIYSIMQVSQFLKYKPIKASIIMPIFLALMLKNLIYLCIYTYLGLNIKPLILDNERTIREYCNADWIIFGGGEYINNAEIGTLIALYEILIGRLLKKPIMFYAQSFGPFDQGYTRILTKSILNKVDIITTREGISKKYLQEIGVSVPIFETADIAFALPPISSHESMKLIKHALNNSEYKLLVGVTAIYKDFSSKKPHLTEATNTHIDAIAGAVDYVIESMDASVIFFPHNKVISQNRNDELASRKIFEKIKHQNRVILLREDYTPEQLKGMYGCMDLFIGTRYHSCIFALSMKVPTIIIGYSHKAVGITRMLGLEKYVCNINTITTSELISLIDMLWIEREKVRDKLNNEIKLMQNRSSDNTLLAIEYLGKLSKYA